VPTAPAVPKTIRPPCDDHVPDRVLLAFVTSSRPVPRLAMVPWTESVTVEFTTRPLITVLPDPSMTIVRACEPLSVANVPLRFSCLPAGRPLPNPRALDW